jgi:inhibitor of KinA sporulation pathway (predicted exonuclease)
MIFFENQTFFFQWSSLIIENTTMSKSHKNIVVVDIEATCWEGKPQEGQQSEIIEIGLCVLDCKSCEPIDKESFIIKPVLSEVSPFCTQLTSITAEMVENGMDLKEACQLIRKKYTSYLFYAWASFGNYDRKQIERECAMKRITYPLPLSHINVKNLITIVKFWEKEEGMSVTLEKLGLPLIGTHHRGVDDAWNIAQIMGHILKLSR